VSAHDRAPGRVLPRSPAAAALLPRFLEHRRGDVATIRAALERDDFETIGRLGHNMAGNGISYGLPEISTIGERLEADAEARDAKAVREQLASLEASLARVEQ
jgi:HPt (histidine-containing phosphotransfer) domain-containing protein